jgi:protein ImuB
VRAPTPATPELLRRFSPRIEADPERDDLWWLDARGLTGLWPDLQTWASDLRAALKAAGHASRLTVGRSRSGVWAAVFHGPACRIFATPAEEQAALAATPLACLPLPPTDAGELQRLGMTTVGALVAHSPDVLADRFGPVWRRWGRRLRDDDPRPLHGPPPSDLPTVQRSFEPPEHDRERLLFAGLHDLQTLLGTLSARGDQPASLRCELALRSGRRTSLDLQAAAPTHSRRIWADLLRLRLDATSLDEPVAEWTLTPTPVRRRAEQLPSPAARPARDPAAALQALARLRTAFGAAAVGILHAADVHLPEARNELRNDPPAAAAQPSPAAAPAPRVRRLYRTPRLCEPATADAAAYGPFRLSGGWWQGEVVRDLWWLCADGTRWRWLAHDRRRNRWLELGELA